MTIRGFRALGLFVTLMSGMTGCNWDWQQPTMRYTGRLKPYEESEFFDNGSSARPLVADTVPRVVQAGWADASASIEVRTGKTFRNGKSELVAQIPVPINHALVERGRQRYNIYCIACHGPSGYGDGIVTQRGFPNPPSYHDDRLRSSPAGHFFDVITNGFGRMYRYGDRVPTYDRWAIVAYIRALQLSQNEKVSALSADERAQLVDLKNEAKALELDTGDGPVKERR